MPPPTVIADHDRYVILHGDSASLGDVLPENSVDAIVTDPPAGISFMGKAWDDDKGGRDQWIAWLAELLKPALRALKPGGHALVWAIPRTSHWTAMALELAGFEIRDVHHHLFGTGFPKSLTSKSAEIPDGAGTALKPAVEHWILARKPLDGTVAETYAKHRTGVLNIDACRIGTSGETFTAPQSNPENLAGGNQFNFDVTAAEHMQAAQRESTERLAALGRWPAHLSLEHAETCRRVGAREESRDYGTDIETRSFAKWECVIGCPVRLLDEQSGILKSGSHGPNEKRAKAGGNGITHGTMAGVVGASYGDTGGASRFFYVAKGSRREKDAGLAHLTPKTGGEATGREEGSAGTANPRAGAGRTGGARNHHPTVKSIDLMRWLIRLVTPPGGVVLDMFAGSGTTGCAALAENCRFVGCEQAAEYLPILTGRLAHAAGITPLLEAL